MKMLPRALEDAFKTHQGQLWKDQSSPFIVHPLRVVALILKYGGSEEQAIAGALHDTPFNPEIESRYGAKVYRLIETFQDPELPPEYPDTWQDRKKVYLNKLAERSEEELLVIACEELDELGDFLVHLRLDPVKALKRFPVHGFDTYWYFRELLRLFIQKGKSPAFKDLITDYSGKLKILHDPIFEGNRQSGNA